MHAAELWVDGVDAGDEDVGDAGLSLEFSLGDGGGAVAGGVFVFLEDVGPEDEVGDACLVFEGDEDDA